MDAHIFEYYRSLFSYDKESGVLTRLKGQFKGRKQTAQRSTGHVVTYVAGKSMYVHRVIWMMLNNEFPSGEIDHINGDSSDNRIENLRVASHQENTRNRRSPRAKDGRPKGVKLLDGRYYAEIYSRNKRFPLGVFDNQSEAAHAYNKAAIAHHGEFACLNPL